MSFRTLCRSILFVVVGSLCAMPGFAVTREYNQTIPLLPGGTFELQNVNGTVRVEGWDRNEIAIHAVKTARNNKESDLDLVSIDVDSRPDAVSVATRYPQDEGVEVQVEYVIHVPRGARVGHVGTVNGTLHISGIDAVQDLRTVNGSIEVFEGGGSVHARTTNGNVHLELSHTGDPSGTMAETTNGSVLLALPFGTQANLETRCLNGNFFSELPVSLEGSLRPREMHGKFGNGGAPIRLHTINGGIRVVALRSTN
jgi:hypothetical protein